MEVVIKRSDFGVSKFVPAITDELFVHITLSADLHKRQWLEVRGDCQQRQRSGLPDP